MADENYIANEGPGIPTLQDVLSQGPFDSKIEELIAEGKKVEGRGDMGNKMAAKCYREALDLIRERWEEICSKAPSR